MLPGVWSILFFHSPVASSREKKMRFNRYLQRHGKLVSILYFMLNMVFLESQTIRGVCFVWKLDYWEKTIPEETAMLLRTWSNKMRSSSHQRTTSLITTVHYRWYFLELYRCEDMQISVLQHFQKQTNVLSTVRLWKNCFL